MIDKVTNQASRLEIFAWAMFDFANSSYSTVVATTIFSAYFIQVIAGNLETTHHGAGTLLLTCAITISSLLIVFSAPIIGAIADARACKKRFLVKTTFICIGSTICLALVKPGEINLAVFLLILANFAFGTGENLIAAFLPEIANRNEMGRVSAFGWTLGYTGGLLVLLACFIYVSAAEKAGQSQIQYVPITLFITALFFALGSSITFLILKERAVADTTLTNKSVIKAALARLSSTFNHAKHYKDLFMFLIILFFYSSGIAPSILLASVYAQKVIGFTTHDCIIMIFVVNIIAAGGAYIFGYIQDKLGSVPTLRIALFIWILATVIAYLSETRFIFWIACILVGLALGSSQSVGRALVGQFSPENKSAEFFGLWGLVVKLATATGPLIFGLVTYLSQNNYRLAILSSTVFFIIAIILLSLIDEKRGRAAALQEIKYVL
jgi:UMF1 family MFS transporter